jgi:hypothetical protein
MQDKAPITFWDFVIDDKNMSATGEVDT